MTDRERFKAAAMRVIAEESAPLGIGTLAEKLVHKTLKLYFEPRVENHEVEYLGSVADIMGDEGIIEIQRAAYARLLPKLKKFLPSAPVTVVYPVVGRKRLRWLDPESGEISSTGRHIRGKTLYDTAFELMKISELIGNERLRVLIVFLECDEYRLLNGRGEKKKIKAGKIDMIPTDLLDIIELKERDDYRIFLPEDIGEEFTARQFYRVCPSRSRYSYYSLRLLCEVGLLTREKVGKEYIYKKLFI
ncbi:MAG: hypothetical protein IJX38_02310 [Clostridia bacterium]|nr:hypothetical protein [Clostridia bacterium]MBQ8371762.1 hypothetical protein [Clostridia bacterium]